MTQSETAALPSRRWAITRALGFSVLVAPGVAIGRTPGFAWPHGARGAVSLTYDDGLNSQLDYAVPQLEASGFKATFFLVQENMEARLDDWVKVGQLGHEIGDHTENHPCGLASYSGATFEARQINPMERFLNAHFGRSHSRSYAYPCGYIGLGRGTPRDRIGRYAQVVGRDFMAARTTVGAPIDPRHAWRERTHLPGFEPTYDVDDPTLAYAYLQKAIRAGNWAILIFHDVTPRRMGEGGASMAVHQQILDYIAAEPLWCAPMGEVFQAVTRRS